VNALENTNPGLPAVDDFAAVKAQLIKDLGADLATPEMAAAHTMDELKSRLLPIVMRLIATGKPRLMQLIYRVDITEARLGRELENLPPEAAAQRMTELIVEREALKVELRRRLG